MLKVTLEFEDGQVYETRDVGFATMLAEVKYQLPAGTSKDVIFRIADFARNIYLDKDEYMRPDLVAYAAAEVYGLIWKYGYNKELVGLIEQLVMALVEKYDHSF